MTASRTGGYAVAGATVLALLVRAPFLGDSLWYDEIAAFAGYSMDGAWGAVGRYFSQANHVLASLLAWMSAEAFGVDEVSVRLPALVAGLAAVPATAWLGREAGGMRVGATAAFAMACMPTAVLPSTEARGYALMVLFSALSSAALLCWLRAGRRAAWWCCAASYALGAWSHLVFACVPAFHAAWLAWRWVRAPRTDLADDGAARRRSALGLAAVAAGGAAAVGLYAPILGQLLRMRDEFRALDGNEPTLFGPEGAWMLWSVGGSWTGWAALAALPLAVAGVGAAVRDRALRAALVVSLGGVVVALLFPTVLGSWLYARFIAFTVPGIAVLLGAGACALWSRARWAGAACSVLAIAGWTAALVTLGPRQPLREAVELVCRDILPGDRAFAVGLPDDVHAWYAAQKGLAMPGSGPYGRELAGHLADPSMRWCVLLYPRALADRRAALAGAGFEEVRRFEGWIDQGDGAVLVLRRR